MKILSRCFGLLLVGFVRATWGMDLDMTRIQTTAPSVEVYTLQVSLPSQVYKSCSRAVNSAALAQVTNCAQDIARRVYGAIGPQCSRPSHGELQLRLQPNLGLATATATATATSTYLRPTSTSIATTATTANDYTAPCDCQVMRAIFAACLPAICPVLVVDAVLATLMSCGALGLATTGLAATGTAGGVVTTTALLPTPTKGAIGGDGVTAVGGLTSSMVPQDSVAAAGQVPPFKHSLFGLVIGVVVAEVVAVMGL